MVWPPFFGKPENLMMSWKVMNKCQQQRMTMPLDLLYKTDSAFLGCGATA